MFQMPKRRPAEVEPANGCLLFLSFFALRFVVCSRGATPTKRRSDHRDAPSPNKIGAGPRGTPRSLRQTGIFSHRLGGHDVTLGAFFKIREPAGSVSDTGTFTIVEFLFTLILKWLCEPSFLFFFIVRSANITIVMMTRRDTGNLR